METAFTIIGTIIFIIVAFVALNFFLHWLSGATNTKFVSKYGDRVIIDNTAKNSPNYNKVFKSKEELAKEEMLLELRKQLRVKQMKEFGTEPPLILRMRHEDERKKLRERHAFQINFRSDFEMFNFIETDKESPIDPYK